VPLPRPRALRRQPCKPTPRCDRFLTSPDARLLVCFVTTDPSRNVLGRAALFPSAEHEVDRFVRQRMHRRRLRPRVATVSGPLNAFGKRSRAGSLERALNGLNPGQIRDCAHRSTTLSGACNLVRCERSNLPMRLITETVTGGLSLAEMRVGRPRTDGPKRIRVRSSVYSFFVESGSFHPTMVDLAILSVPSRPIS
jgi:hypothetical protein